MMDPQKLVTILIVFTTSQRKLVTILTVFTTSQRQLFMTLELLLIDHNRIEHTTHDNRHRIR